MELYIEMVGIDANEESTLALKNWLNNEQIIGLQIERQSANPKKGDMGIEPLSALAVILGSSAVVQLVKSIHVWIEVRKPKLKLKLKRGDNEVEIDVENLKDQQEIIENLLADFQVTEE